MTLSQSDIVTIWCTIASIGVAIAIALWHWLRGRRGHGESFPFRLVPVEELDGHLPSPLMHSPDYVDRRQNYDMAHPFYLITGGKGVGKTREALELVRKLVRAHGAQAVYVKRGYLTPPARLPQDLDVKKVVVLIDDYDYGEKRLTSSAFSDRAMAVARVVADLRRTFEFFKQRVEICGFVATANSYRLPLSSEERGELSPACRIIELSSVDSQTYAAFLDNAAKILSLTITPEARAGFIESCDGQVGSIATYLSTIQAGSTLTKQSVRDFAEKRKTLWKSFRRELTDEQRSVYNCLAMLRLFRLNTRLAYVLRFIGKSTEPQDKHLLTRAIEAVWSIEDGCIVTYDGQFPEDGDRPPLESVAAVVLKCGRHLQRHDRSVFQEELKLFLGEVMDSPSVNTVGRLLRRVRGWYPQDRYFGYLHATLLSKQRKWISATAVLFHYLRESDPSHPESVWMEVQLHLLLGSIYMSGGLGSRLTPEKVYSRVEHEFRIAVFLTQMSESDLKLLQPRKRPTQRFRRRYSTRNYNIRELGYIPPFSLPIDVRRLRATAYHEYAKFLSQQTHREHDALSCEKAAIDCIPEFGEAHVTAATLCLSLGDTSQALEHLNRARQARPLVWSAETYSFMLARETWRVKQDAGEEQEARKSYEEALGLASEPPLNADVHLREAMQEARPGTEGWEQRRRLARTRTKHFGDHLEYTVHPYGVTLRLPKDWKVDRESATAANPPDVSAIFSSQVFWDETGTKEADACIIVLISGPADDSGQSGHDRALGIMDALSQTKGTSVKAYSLIDNEKRGAGDLSVWEYEISQRKWPKRGLMLSFDRGDSNFLLQAMCQVSGLGLLWQAVEQTVGDLFEQEYFSGAEAQSTSAGILNDIRKRSVDRSVMSHRQPELGAVDIDNSLVDELFRRHMAVPSDIATRAHLVGVLALQLVHHTQAQGLSKLARENLNFVRRLAEEGIAQAPDEPAFYDVLGILSDIEGDHTGARRNFREFGHKFGHAFWRIRTATSYELERDLTRAVQEVKLGMDEGLGVIGYIYLGKFLDGLGRYDEALEAFKNADSAGVKAPSLLPELQRAYFRIMDVSGVLDLGIRIISQAIRFRPDDQLSTISHAIITSALAASCRMSKAMWPVTCRVPGLRWVHLRFFPPYEPEMQFGLQLVENHSFDGALAVFTRALDSCPDNPDVMRNIAAIHFNMGHLKKALSWAEKALNARPDDGELRDITARLKMATQHGA